MKPIWINSKKSLKKQCCVGSYIRPRGVRRFKLTDSALGKSHIFNSVEAAKALGWRKI